MSLLANKPMLGTIALTVALQLMIIYVPFFNDLFTTEPLTWAELGIVLAMSSVVFWAVEIQKLIIRQRDIERESAHKKSVVAAPVAD